MGLDLDRVPGQRWLGAAMVAASLWLTGLPLMAQPSGTAPLTAASLQPYGYNDLFTIGLPANWQINQQSQAPQVTALAPAGDGRVLVGARDHSLKLLDLDVLNRKYFKNITRGFF